MIAASRWEWLDFDEDESKQVRDFLSRDVDGEGVDALRIGASVRDEIAEELFPGTSTQYTRLRYVIFVAAMLRKKGMKLENLADSQAAFNAALINANGSERGLIGKRTPSRDFVHLYWTAVRTWNMITSPSAEGRDVTVANGLAAFHAKDETDDDGNSLVGQRVVWNTRLTSLVDQFWDDKAGSKSPSIHCRQVEVDFIVDQWLALPGDPVLAVFAALVRKGRKPSRAEFPWQVAVGINAGARASLDRAKAVSLICWGVQLAYNFALLKEARKLNTQAESTCWKQKNQDLGETETKISSYFEDWKAALAVEKVSVAPWTNASTWKELGNDRSRTFLTRAAALLVAGDSDLRSAQWFDLVREREQVNPAPKLGNRTNLASWSGTPEMAKRWDFRWRACVCRFMQDAENPHG